MFYPVMTLPHAEERYNELLRKAENGRLLSRVCPARHTLHDVVRLLVALIMGMFH